MLNDVARKRFLDNLPTDMQSIILHLEGSEPWVHEDDNEILVVINEIGDLLNSHEKMSKLKSLPTEMLVKLMVCMSLTRFFAFWSQMSDYQDYADLVIRTHKDLSHNDAETENYQRALLSRLQTIVKHTMIARIYNPQRLELIKDILRD